jgi:outer membrane protein OmpA-like peptidoglycan-associated protein
MKQTLTVAAVCAALALASCTTTDPYTGEERHSHVGEGAVQGGIIGAIIGAVVSRHPGRGALVGAGIGAVAGGALGAIRDRQEAYYRHHFRGYRHVHVHRRGDRVVMAMENDFLFESGSAELHPLAQNTLRRMAHGLNRQREQASIAVYGYTDTVGPAEANMQLSQARADAVAEALRRYGVEDERIVTRGYGETHLRIRTPDDVDEPRNRRVEIVLEPPVG